MLIMQRSEVRSSAAVKEWSGRATWWSSYWAATFRDDADVMAAQFRDRIRSSASGNTATEHDLIDVQAYGFSSECADRHVAGMIQLIPT